MCDGVCLGVNVVNTNWSRRLPLWGGRGRARGRGRTQPGTEDSGLLALRSDLAQQADPSNVMWFKKIRCLKIKAWVSSKPHIGDIKETYAGFHFCRKGSWIAFHTHCKDTILKIWNKYSQKRNCVASVPISTFMYLWAIYIFPRSICLFCCRQMCGPILGIYKSLTDTWMWK